jgi:surfactin family lipopeptide synthetase A/fengycin family lipopeptide synthetase D
MLRKSINQRSSLIRGSNDLVPKSPISDKKNRSENLTGSSWLQDAIKDIWILLLNRSDFELEDDFFSLGGDSMKAIQLASYLYDLSKVELTLTDVFNNSSIVRLSRLVTQKSSLIGEQTPGIIVPIEDQEYYNVSHGQKRLWITSQTKGTEASYNMHLAYELTNLDIDKFSQVFEILVKRHESLRTSIISIDNEPKQKVNNKVSLPVLQVVPINESLSKVALDELIFKEVQRPFELTQSSLFRAVLFTRDNSRNHVFVFTIHHIISDGWSMSVFINEVLNIYGSLTHVDSAPVIKQELQYRDYAAYHNQMMNEGSLLKYETYWMNKFAKKVAPVDIPPDFLRPAIKTFNGNTIRFRLEENLTKRLINHGHENGLTPYVIFLAGVNALLHYYTGQSDLVIGSGTTGRDYIGLDNQIGFFVNTIPFRLAVNANESFSMMLENTKKMVLEGYENQKYPFDVLIDKLKLKRQADRSPLFEIMAIVQQTDITNKSGINELHGVSVKHYQLAQDVSKFDLQFVLVKNHDQLDIDITYNTDLYAPTTIQGLFRNYTILLSALLQNPSRVLAEQIKVLHEEATSLLNIVNDTDIEYLD